ncbi:MAG: amidohydrolase family protein [Candidatus Helarchaeota archaeon]
MSNHNFKISDFRYIDSHIHFFPESLFKAIWSYWKRVYLPLFPNWYNLYEWKNKNLIQFLKEKKIEKYTTLNYAHKKGIAENLNQWTYMFLKNNPAAIPFGTAHPDDDNMMEYSKKAFSEYKFKGYKFQLMVTNFFIHDSRLKPLYKLMHDLDKILYLHAGTAPSINQMVLPDAKVGVKHFQKYFQEFSDNRVVIAHMGGYEYEDFFKIVEKNSNVYLDTTMIFIPQKVHVFSQKDRPENFVGRKRLLSFMEENSSKILFGTDFPNIPYDYEQSIIGMLDLNLSRKAYQNIFFNNALKLFNLHM